MNCTNCGAEVYPGDRFCMRCGARAPEEPPPVVQPERPAPPPEPVVEPEQPEAQPPPPPAPTPPPSVEAERLQATPPPPPPAFVAPQPAAPPPKRRSGRIWVIVGIVGVLAVACVVVAISGAWLLGYLSRTGGIAIGVPTSTPRAAPTGMPTFPPTPTRQPTSTPSPTELPATPTSAPEPTAQGGAEVFSCTSADADCGWEPYSDAYGEAYAVGPELFLKAKGPFALAEAEIPGVRVQDFVLSFIGKLRSAESGVGGYAAAFRFDPSNEDTYYEFELRASGEWWVWKWVDAIPTDIASGTVELDASGEDSVMVMADGPWLSFMVNGLGLTDVTDAEVRTGPIHLMAFVLEEEAEIEVAFSEVTVQAW